jgi:hypothetical protein
MPRWLYWVWTSSLTRFRDHTQTHHTRQHSSGQDFISLQRPSFTDNTQHSQQGNIHARGGIRNLDSSKQTAADPNLRLRGHCDRRCPVLLANIFLHINFSLGISVKQQSISAFSTSPRNQGVKMSLLQAAIHYKIYWKTTVPISVLRKEFTLALLGDILCVGKGNYKGLLHFSEILPAIYETLILW